LHEELRHAGHDVTVFNFAGPYHGVEYDQRLLQDIVLKITRPRLIVYGVTPISVLHEKTAGPIDDVVGRLPAFHLHDGTVGARLYGALLTHVSLLAYREVIRDALTPGKSTVADLFTRGARATDAFGDIRLMTASPRVRGLTRYEQRHRKDLSLLGDLLTATEFFPRLEAFARFCAGHGIELVLMNNAVHPLFLQLLPGGEADYARFVARLRAVADATGARFFDPAAGRPADPALFHDTHHHNQAGGVWATDAVARYLIENRLVGR
jgi:hypothetical protein